MKKILSIILASLLVFGSQSGSSAADFGLTVITRVFMSNSPYTVEFKHPTAVTCEPYVAPQSYYEETHGGNCSFSIAYQFTQGEDTISDFILLQDELGKRVGQIESGIWMSDKYGLNKWVNATVSARVKSPGKFFLVMDTIYDYNGSSATSKVQTPIFITVKSQAVADQEKALKEKQDAAELATRQKAVSSKKLSIVCTRGASKKTISGNPPKCPSGYVFGGASNLTYQAFVQCKLYQKNSTYSGVKLGDQSRTLEFVSYGLGSEPEDLNDGDFDCALRVLKVSSAVRTKIGLTRAIDGQLTAKVGPMNAYWTYHPDSGLNITFTYLKI